MRQTLQLHMHREAPLQFRNQVADLRHMERARRDKENVIGFNRAVLCSDCRTFHYRENIPLHALAGHVHAARFFLGSDFVYLVYKYYSFLFGSSHALGDNRVLVNELSRFFFGHKLHRFLNGYALFLSLFRHKSAENGT